MALVETVRHAGAGSAVLVCKGAGTQTETPLVPYTFDVELIFSHCAFRNLLLLPAFFMIPVTFKKVGHRKALSLLSIPQSLTWLDYSMRCVGRLPLLCDMFSQ